MEIGGTFFKPLSWDSRGIQGTLHARVRSHYTHGGYDVELRLQKGGALC